MHREKKEREREREREEIIIMTRGGGRNRFLVRYVKIYAKLRFLRTGQVEIYFRDLRAARIIRWRTSF